MEQSTAAPLPQLRWFLLVLFGLPLLLILAKLPGMPTEPWAAAHVTLENAPANVQHHIGHILLVPLGALLVVLVRLTFGLRVLGPFRSILLALAFQITGLLPGLIFLAATVGIVVGIRPTIKALKLPYFGRISVMLSGVALIMTIGVMAADWFQLPALHAISYLPIVVLCLIADAFARTMKTEGTRSALWRSAMTALVAVLLAGLVKIPGLQQVLLHYPELLMAQIGGIMVVSRFMNWRLLERFNPKVGLDEEDEFESEEVRVRVKRTTLEAKTSESKGAAKE